MAEAITIRQAVEKHSNPLFDVVALLDAAAERIESATPSCTENPEGADFMQNTLRLVQMAMETVKAAADDMLNAAMDISPRDNHG
jgi:hypothetical protein